MLCCAEMVSLIHFLLLICSQKSQRCQKWACLAGLGVRKNPALHANHWKKQIPLVGSPLQIPLADFGKATVQSPLPPDCTFLSKSLIPASPARNDQYNKFWGNINKKINTQNSEMIFKYAFGGHFLRLKNVPKQHFPQVIPAFRLPNNIIWGFEKIQISKKFK